MEYYIVDFPSINSWMQAVMQRLSLIIKQSFATHVALPFSNNQTINIKDYGRKIRLQERTP